MNDLDLLIALQGSLQSALIHVQTLVERIQKRQEAQRTPKPEESDTDECAHSSTIDLPGDRKMCQTCGAQKAPGEPWQS